MVRPAVSVVLPFRDAAPTITASVRSVLAQSFSDFELLCIDDGSHDAGASILRDAVGGDPRVHLVDNPGRGLVAALNHGLALARASLVARMDADDVMSAQRLALQHAYLSRHQDLAALASRVEAFPTAALGPGMREYLTWQDRCLGRRSIADQLYVEAPMVHPTMMMRAAALQRVGGYREGAFPEDYELWLRMHAAGFAFAKLPQRLLRWRVDPHSTSRTDPRYARAAFDAIRAHYLARDPRLRSERERVVWGAGRRTRRRLDVLRGQGVSVQAFIDIDPRKIGQKIEGICVHPPQWLAGRDPRPLVLVYVASHGARARIARALAQMGYRRGRDVIQVG